MRTPRVDVVDITYTAVQTYRHTEAKVRSAEIPVVSCYLPTLI